MQLGHNSTYADDGNNNNANDVITTPTEMTSLTVWRNAFFQETKVQRQRLSMSMGEKGNDFIQVLATYQSDNSSDCKTEEKVTILLITPLRKYDR